MRPEEEAALRARLGAIAATAPTAPSAPSRSREGSRLGVVAVMIVSALAFAWFGRPAAGGEAVEVQGISVRRGAPARLDGPVPDEPWADAVVRVETRRCDGDNSVATGVLVDGVVLTDRHVVEGAAQVTVETLRGERHDAASMRLSGSIDLATLVVDELDGGLELADEDAAEGDLLTMVGFPGGGRAVVSTVTIDGRDVGVAYPDSTEPLRLTSAVVAGQSGSPLIDDGNRLVGLIYSRSRWGSAGLAHRAGEIERHWPAMGRVAFDDCR